MKFTSSKNKKILSNKVHSTNYLYFSLLSEKFEHLRLISHRRYQIVMYDNRYRTSKIYIKRTSDKCYRVFITFKFDFVDLSFRTIESIVRFFKKLDNGGFTFYESGQDQS